MFKKTVLKNGLRVVISPLKETKAVTILALFKVGSRFEEANINGISHFIEHMMFKGTKKWPDTLSLSRELDSVGAEYNAFTSKDYTGYYIKIDAEKFKLAIDLLHDMLFASKFDGEELEREKGVIIEEINMYEDNPMMFVEELCEESLYQGNTLGWLISGSRKTVSEINRGKLFHYYQKHYFSQNMVLGIGGKITPQAMALVKKYFGGENNKSKKIESFDKFMGKFIAPRVKLKYKDTEQVQIAMGWPAYAYQNPKLPALTILNLILGATMSSRLFISVREKRGLAYFIRSSANIYEDTGNLMIHSGLDKTRVFEAIKVILEELKKISTEGVTAEELKKAKDCIKGKIVLDLEDSSSITEWYTKQELLTKEILTPEQKLKKIFQVTANDVKKVAKEIFVEQGINLAVVGPFKDEQEFLKILKI